ncbi:MAG: ABC transporter ATP-binding protein [Firmicutes bacterium]|nr:ABC transporter ATP-binding protein [Bacillota bacterium]
MANTETNSALLRVEELVLHYRTRAGTVQAVDGVSFSLDKGQTLAILGESGCGKSSLGRGLLRLLPRNVKTYSGSIFIGDLDTMTLGDRRYRRDVRWRRLALVPQAALNTLNPVLKVGYQVAEPLLVHRQVKKKSEALEKVRHLFNLLGLSTDFLNRYAFELSGGMRQRVAIAMALISDPDVVVLDEPTSALDLLTQANIMNVLKRIKKDMGMTFVFITHDVGTASELADVVAVMYAGEMVELAPAENFYTDPLHPYSERLMASVPTLREEKELQFIPGQPPSLINPPGGCRFAARCHKRLSQCTEKEPPMTIVDKGSRVKCWLYQ